MRILVADDHTLFRRGIILQLQELDDRVEVVEAKDFAETQSVFQEATPLSLALVDLAMPPGSDWKAGLRSLRKIRPEVPIVVLSGFDTPATIRDALDCGASGFVPKNETPDVMLHALRLVMAGGRYVPASAMFGGAAPMSEAKGSLSPRQGEVLNLLKDGLTNKEIAFRLKLAEGTVKLHVAAILKELGAVNRTEAVAIARSRGLIF